MENQDHYMQLALKLAEKAASMDEVPIGAVLVHGGQVIGEGYNSREKTGKTTGHAEIEALEDYNRRTGQWRLPLQTSLFVTIEPCMMCTGALLSARVSSIFFGAPDPKAAGLTSFQAMIEQGVFDHRFEEVVGGIALEQCSHLVSDYFRGKRGKNKQK